jgi:hypothetical protein
MSGRVGLLVGFGLLALPVNADAKCTNNGKNETTQHGPYFFNTQADTPIDIGVSSVTSVCAPQGFAGPFTDGSTSAGLTIISNGDYAAVGTGTSTHQVAVNIGCVARNMISFPTLPPLETYVTCHANPGLFVTISNTTGDIDGWIEAFNGLPAIGNVGSSIPFASGLGGGDVTQCGAGPTSFIEMITAAITSGISGQEYTVGPQFGRESLAMADDSGGYWCYVSTMSGPWSVGPAIGIVQGAACSQTLEELNCSGSSCPNVDAICIPLRPG